jgi:hypothetical protein
VLPLTFAAVLAVIFKPLVRILERYKVWPALAAGIVVLGLLALVTGVIRRSRGILQRAAERARPAVQQMLDWHTRGRTCLLPDGVLKNPRALR